MLLISAVLLWLVAVWSLRSKIRKTGNHDLRFIEIALVSAEA